MLLIGLIPGVYPLLKYGINSWDIYILGGIVMGLGFFTIGFIGKLLMREDSMGMGDVKYAGLIGLILGWQQGLLVTAIAFFSAALLILLSLPFGRVVLRQKIPFAPFLSFGVIISIFWGSSIISWYINFITS
jgi:prepilin signal peptidase PulO-like enzyme (type II secretory pathway)